MATSVSSSGSEEDRTRFFRLSLVIIDELKRILQDLVENEVPSAQIFQKVKQVNYLEKLRPEQIAVIKNASSRGYQDFDVTLLYTLLRNVCQNITPPSQRWGVFTMPSPNEVTVGDDIERIRLIRNKFGHISETAISKTEFNEYWSIISGICTRIQTLLNKDYVKRLQDAEGCSMDSDTEKKYLRLIWTMAEEEKTTRDILQNIQSTLTEFTSTETIKFEPKIPKKRKLTETLSDTSIFILNEMINVVNKMTTESEISELYELIEVYIQDNKEEIENKELEDLLTKLREKITVYANMQKENQMQILARFLRFNIMLKKKYEAHVDYSKSCIQLLVTFSSRMGYDLYKKDLENGQIGEHIHELFLYPPFLDSFGLKADDIEISLNGSLLTRHKGSIKLEDPLDVIRCDRCETPVPTMHCDTCHINLCKKCVVEHISDEFNSHRVVSVSKRGDTDSFPKCPTHYPKGCELLCAHCNIPICASCISSGDHEHHHFKDIFEHLINKKEIIKRDMSELKESIRPKYQECAKNIRFQRNHVKKTSKDILEALKNQREELHKKIDTCIEEKVSEINNMDAQCIEAINRQEKEINNTITEIKKVILDLQNLLKTDDVKRVFEYESRNDEFRNLPIQFDVLDVTFPTVKVLQINTRKIEEQINSLLDQVISFPAKKFIDDPSITKEHSDQVKTGSSSASLSTEPLIGDPAITEEYDFPMKTEKHGSQMKTQYDVSPRTVKRFINDPQILEDINTENGQYSVSCLSDSELWTCCHRVNILRLYNLQGKLLRSVQTKSGSYPMNLAVTRDKAVVYADYLDGSINLVRDTQIQTLIRLKGWLPFSLCDTSSGDLLVIMESDDGIQTKVVRYSGSTPIQSVQWDDQGKPLYASGTYFKYLSENKNLDICVTNDPTCAVVVVSAAGKLRFRYTAPFSTSKSKFRPRGITTDSQGNILIADFDNKRIHIIDQDGNFLRYIDNCGLCGPFALCVDSRDNLFVTEIDTSKIKKIKYYE